MRPFEMNMGSSRQNWEEFSNEAVKQAMDMPHNRRCDCHLKPAPSPTPQVACMCRTWPISAPTAVLHAAFKSPSRLAFDQARRLSTVLSMATIQETARNLQNSIAEPLDHKHIGLIGGKSHG